MKQNAEGKKKKNTNLQHPASQPTSCPMGRFELEELALRWLIAITPSAGWLEIK